MTLCTSIKKGASSPLLWACVIIVMGLTPLILGNIIIGLLMMIAPIGLMLLAKRSNSDKTEWFILSLIVLMFCFILLFNSDSLGFVYPLVVYALGLFIASFSFNNENFIKEKMIFDASENKEDILISGEAPDDQPLNPNNTSALMAFHHAHNFFGSAIPLATHGYNFTFYETGIKVYNMITAKEKWRFPFFYPLRSYYLEEGDKILLGIRNIGWGRVIVELSSGDSFTIPLYKRKLELNSKEGKQLNIRLFHEGILTRYAWQEGEKDSITIACISYFLWLMIFGGKRTRD